MNGSCGVKDFFLCLPTLNSYFKMFNPNLHGGAQPSQDDRQDKYFFAKICHPWNDSLFVYMVRLVFEEKTV